ncbi:MAG: MaoC/PaaZ C-terminal domain-containing protein [Luteibaculaceae bacterium]
MPNPLPELKNLFLPSIRTVLRGVRIKESGIQLSEIFNDVTVDSKTEQAYNTLFHFKETSSCFWYLMAQRAQAKIMLNPKFSIRIPGLVHISNSLQELAPINPDKPFEIEVSVLVEYKESGSLLPMFTVLFKQDGETKLRCESLYLVKRRSKKKKSKLAEPETEKRPRFLEEPFVVSKNTGKIYGKASGDRNPIHTSKTFAKVLGFQGAILQGWYGVSFAVSSCEAKLNRKIKDITVEFKTAVVLPCKLKLLLFKETENTFYFEIVHEESGKTATRGWLA